MRATKVTSLLKVLGVLSAMLLIGANNPESVRIMSTGGSLSSDPAPTCGGDLFTSGYDVVNQTSLTGDSAANVGATLQTGTNASPFATTAANKIGGATIIAGGIGTTGGTSVAGAACAGKTVTVSGTDTKGAAFTATLTDGGNWTHSDTAATNATNLAAAISAHASLSPYVTASASSTSLGVTPIPGKVTSLTIATSDAACVVVVNGTDGRILVADNGQADPATPDIASTGDPNTGIDWRVGDALGFSAGGSEMLRVDIYGINTAGKLRGSGVTELGSDVAYGDDFYPLISSTASDAAPVITVISTQEPYAPASPPATAPTNTTGGNLVLAASNGGRRLGSAGANGLCVADPCVYPAGQTITIPVQVDGVVTNCVLTSAAATSAASREFLCDGQTPAVCGANIVTAASTVSPCSLMTVVSANKTVSFSRKAGSTSYLGAIVPSASGITAQNGTDGIVSAGGAYPVIVTTASSAPLLANLAKPGAGVRLDSNGDVAFLGADGTSTQHGRFTGGTLVANNNIIAAGTITSTSTGSVGWHIVSAANQACDTTCTSAAVHGWDGTTPVNHDDATADICLCAGAN